MLCARRSLRRAWVVALLASASGAAGDAIQRGAVPATPRKQVSLREPLLALRGGGATLPVAAGAYTAALTEWPIATKALTSGVIFALSDVVAQRIAGDERDWWRAAVAGLVGLLYFGPSAHFWYELMEALYPGHDWRSTLAKTAAGQAPTHPSPPHLRPCVVSCPKRRWGQRRPARRAECAAQLIFGPVFTCVFFAATLVSNGGVRQLEHFPAKVRRDMLPTQVARIAASAVWCTQRALKVSRARGVGVRGGDRLTRPRLGLARSSPASATGRSST